MKTSHRRWLMWSAPGALAVAAVVWWAVRSGDDDEAKRSDVLAAAGTPGVVTSTAVVPKQQRQDFSHLPPAERINAETKQRMEHNAAWREKLRSGDYPALPPEAYPPGVPPPGASPPQ